MMIVSGVRRTKQGRTGPPDYSRELKQILRAYGAQDDTRAVREIE